MLAWRSRRRGRKSRPKSLDSEWGESSLAEPSRTRRASVFQTLVWHSMWNKKPTRPRRTNEADACLEIAAEAPEVETEIA